jgi:hypothetical protein
MRARSCCLRCREEATTMAEAQVGGVGGGEGKGCVDGYIAKHPKRL